MPMKHPPHPGGMFLEFCLPGTGMTIESAAAHMGLDSEEFSEICHERAPITAELAVRFAKAFGSTPEVWLGMQTAHDLALAKERFGDVEIRRLPELSEEELDALEASALSDSAKVAD